jgi:small basic protein (TIGR04137 family)
MSMHASLKTARALERHRNVLTRAERIAYLEDHEKFDREKDSVFGLPKVAHRKVAVGGKAKKKAKQGEEGGEEKKI